MSVRVCYGHPFGLNTILHFYFSINLHNISWTNFSEIDMLEKTSVFLPFLAAFDCLPVPSLWLVPVPVKH